MTREDFERRLRDLLPDASDQAAKNWLEYAGELDRDGTESESEIFDRSYVELALIKRHQGAETAAALFNYGEKFVFNYFELRGAARLLTEGWPLERISGYAVENGCNPAPEEFEESKAALRSFQRSRQELDLQGNARQLENKVLKLAADIKQMTGGLCSVGVGPEGFGVSNDNSSELGIVIKETPRFYPDDPDIPPCQDGILTVEAYRKDDGSVLDQETLEQFLRSSSNDATPIIAKAAIELCKAPVPVTREEYETAYNTLAEQVLSNVGFQMQMM